MIRLLTKNKFLIVVALMVLFLALFLRQCNQTKKIKNEVTAAKLIADQNLAALRDSTIQLVLTKEQLKKTDNELYTALQKIDAIGNTTSKTITIVKPVYRGGPTSTPSTLVFDTNRHMFGLRFETKDLVRTIEGISWFELDKNLEDGDEIIPDSTKICSFKLNFTLVVSQYDDKATHFTRTRIVPFHVEDDGTLGEAIPPNLLTVSFRNAEILDKPYTPTSESKKRLGLQSGFALTINPLAVGVYPKNDGGVGWGWTPNIGLGYYLTLRKK